MQSDVSRLIDTAWPSVRRALEGQKKQDQRYIYPLHPDIYQWLRRKP